MKLLTALEDISKHVSKIQHLAGVKLIPAANGCGVEAKDTKNLLCMHAQLNEGVEGLTETVGLGDEPLLRSVLKSPGFRSADAKAIFHPKSTSYPPFAVLSNDRGQDHMHQFMTESYIDQVMKVPSLRGGIPFEVLVQPTKEGIDLLKYWFAEWQEYGEDYVDFATANGDLVCEFAGALRQRTRFAFQRRVTGTLGSCVRIEAEQLLRILDLTSTSKSVVLGVSSVGGVKLEVDSGAGLYRYVMAGRLR